MAVEEQKRHDLVEVTLVVTDEQGATERREIEVHKGATRVAELKAELGVPEEAVLWLIRHDKKRVLGDHETVDVKKGDVFEALVRGGVS